VISSATARLWTDRMKPMLLLATVHAMLSTVIGYWLSHPSILNTSASGAISSAGFGLFLVSWLLAPRRGLLSQYRVRARLRRTMAEENVIKAVHELTAQSPMTSQTLRELLQMPAGSFETALRGVIGRGWATVVRGQIALTDAGRERAQLLASAHELWEQYLRQEVGLADDHLHDPAEWVEHFLDEKRVRELKATLKSA
jgi:Mn-dependent DtxR family transcriptional regulator